MNISKQIARDLQCYTELILRHKLQDKMSKHHAYLTESLSGFFFNYLQLSRVRIK